MQDTDHHVLTHCALNIRSSADSALAAIASMLHYFSSGPLLNHPPWIKEIQ